jgi:mannopine transport system permease protein
VATGAVFAFLTSFDDATVSFFLANLTDVTLPRKMFENLQFFISPVLAVVATLLTVVTLVLVGGVQWLRSGRVD